MTSMFTASAEAIRTVRITGVILVVHSDPQMRAVLREILGRGGYHALQARTSGEAVRLYEQHRESVRLLLVDDLTPELSRLTAAHPGLPLLGLSEAGCEPATPFLLKPFTPDALLKAVRCVLAGASLC